MPAFIIAEVDITNDAWVPDYAQNVHDIVHKHGGKYLSRSGAIDVLEGQPAPATLIALLQFPDKAAARAFVSDAAYKPYLDARAAGSNSRFRLIDDTDLAGTIPYLAKG